MHTFESIQAHAGHYAAHSLAKAFVLGKLRPGEECVPSIRHFDCQHVVGTELHMVGDVDYKRQCAAHVRDGAWLWHLCVAGHGVSVDIDGGADVHALEG